MCSFLCFFRGQLSIFVLGSSDIPVPVGRHHPGSHQRRGYGHIMSWLWSWSSQWCHWFRLFDTYDLRACEFGRLRFFEHWACRDDWFRFWRFHSCDGTPWLWRGGFFDGRYWLGRCLHNRRRNRRSFLNLGNSRRLLRCFDRGRRCFGRFFASCFFYADFFEVNFTGGFDRGGIVSLAEPFPY